MTPAPAQEQPALSRPTPSEVVLVARGITRRFPGVLANDGIDLELRRGEIHSILGENGAGKTTLMNILSGMIRPDAGTIAVRGKDVTLASPHDALAMGIGTVYQHFTLVPSLSVIENAILGMPSGFFLDLARASQRLDTLLGDFGLQTPPDLLVRYLSLGQRQRVEIIKTLFRGAQVLLLDEPTSVLTPQEVEELFVILRRLRADGVAVVFITHKLEEALQISERITILRQGRKMGEIGPETLARMDRNQISNWIIELMFGGLAPEDRTGPAASNDGALTLALHDVTALGDRGIPALLGLSLALRAGEILGIAGVDANGQKELGEVIAGQRRILKGRVMLDGREITNSGTEAATRAGIGYITDDRMGEGCVPSLSVAENLILRAIDHPRFSRRGVLNRAAIEAYADRLIREFDIKTPGPWAHAGTLSGGNVQKLLLARELSLNPRVLVCNKPTHGLDVKTARSILHTLRVQAERGTAVLLISSELDELLEVSDRVGVMYRGELLAVLPRALADRSGIGRLMLGMRP